MLGDCSLECSAYSTYFTVTALCCASSFSRLLSRLCLANSTPPSKMDEEKVSSAHLEPSSSATEKSIYQRMPSSQVIITQD
jgi:hypothetical protein